jgi:hypothetical protein
MTKEEFERSLIEDDQRFYFYIYEDYYEGIQYKNLDKRGIFKGFGDVDGKGRKTTFFYKEPNTDARFKEFDLNNVFKNKIGLKPRIDFILIKNRKRAIEQEKNKKEEFLKEIKKMEMLNK